MSKSRILTHNKCYEPFRVRDMRATINGGETEAPHAHIFKKRMSIGRIFRDGTMDPSLQNNRDGMSFVKEFFDDIMRLIDDYYGKR